MDFQHAIAALNLETMKTDIVLPIHFSSLDSHPRPLKIWILKYMRMGYVITFKGLYTRLIILLGASSYEKIYILFYQHY